MNELTGADFKSATADDSKKLFIETYGCQMNVADSEVIASVMQMAGYSVAETLEEADAVFMNTASQYYIHQSTTHQFHSICWSSSGINVFKSRCILNVPSTLYFIRLPGLSV